MSRATLAASAVPKSDHACQALHNVTSMTRVTTVSAFQTLSYIAEGCIFIYVGLDTLDPLKWKVLTALGLRDYTYFGGPVPLNVASGRRWH